MAVRQQNQEPTWVGCVIKKLPNQYAGFDFYNDKALVWDHEARAPKWIVYSCGHQGGAESGGEAQVDATPAVLQAYAAWQISDAARTKRAARRAELLRRRKVQSERFKIARACGVSYARVKQLETVTPCGKWDCAVKLLTSTRIKSGFKLSLKQQIVNWLAATEQKYRSPLSPKQWGYV